MLCNAEELVLDTCPGTEETTKPCVVLPVHRKSVGYRKSFSHFRAALSSLLFVNAKKVLSLA